MFGRYALPSDDLAGAATSVTVGGSGSPAAEADAEYPATNLIAPTNTGHRNLPSRPAKLTAYEGYWELTWAAPVTIGAAHLVYPNFDPNLDVVLDLGSSPSVTVPTPALFENGWWKSPAIEFNAQSTDTVRLVINEPNSLLPQLGRLLLYESFRDLGNDVRWGVVEEEELIPIEHVTEGGAEILYEVWSPRRSFSGELALMNATASELLTLMRDARIRILPWSLIPDADHFEDAWFVRFLEPRWSRTREMIEHNIFPFRVKELSRGVVFP